MNNDYSYCKGGNCKKKKECKRNIGNHILEFIPRIWIEYSSCIKSKYGMFDNLKEK